MIGLPPGGNPEAATGIFFHNQPPAALREAIAAFVAAEASFCPDLTRARTQRFNLESFKEELTKFTTHRLAEFRGAAGARPEGDDRAASFRQAARATGKRF